MRDSRKKAGFTLVELTLFIGLLGLGALYLANKYVSRFSRVSYDQQQVNKVTRDMCVIIQAAVQWRNDNAQWPNDGTVIDVLELSGPTSSSIDTYLSSAPQNPYQCSNCNYEITGADGDETDNTDADDDDPTTAVNLRVRARVTTGRHADAIADMTPCGARSGSGSLWTVTAEVDAGSGVTVALPECGIPGAACP